MKKRVTKGSYGYIRYMKAFTAIRTCAYFAISMLVYGIGIYSTGSSKNLLTVVAVLGCLPSCKSAINMIMFLTAKGCSNEAREKISPYDDKLTGFYDMYFTSYQKNFAISHMALKGSAICAYTEDAKCNCNEGEKHLEQMLAQDGYKNITIKIFDNMDKYIDRLSQISTSYVEDNKNKNEIIKTLYSVSL
ncbi:MAG: hypothetical protein NC433_04135 [Clostridiales bacterium]|nr:hypothetical protein [Clostridiales bacterium]